MTTSEDTTDPSSVEKYLAADAAPPPLMALAPRKPLWKRLLLWFTPNLTAFIASFCIMVIELVAGRIIARYLGSSLYTWTSVIGVVLGGITIGNLLGGRLADWFRPSSTLAVLFLLAAGACLGIDYLNTAVNEWGGWDVEKKDAGIFAKGLLLLARPDDAAARVRGEIEKKELDLNSSATAEGDKAEMTKELEKLKEQEAEAEGQRKLPWSAHIFGHVFLVFLLPATLLGMIGPVVAKMALDQGHQIGRTVGNVYAWGALGSIVGTFTTGFYLISEFGTKSVTWGVALVLAFVGVLYFLRFFWPVAVLVALVLVYPFYQCIPPVELVDVGGKSFFREKLQSTTDRKGHQHDEVYVRESQYTYMKIVKTLDKKTKEENERLLYMDSLIHAELNPTDPTDLKYDYENIYQAVTHKFASGEDEGAKMSCLFLGGGGYVFPRYIRAKWPRARIEIAEIDPAVTAADVAEFGLKQDDIQVVSSPSDLKREGNPLWIYHMDARNHVEDLLRAKGAGAKVPQFDFVYGDAFNFLGVPFHLTTVEFTEKVKGLLTPGKGIYMVNIIEIFNSGKFLGAVYNTFREVFGENVYVFANHADKPDIEDRDTYIVIGSLQPLDLSGLPGEEPPFSFVGSLLNSSRVDPDDVKYLKDVLEPEVLAKLTYLDVLTDDHHAGSFVLRDDRAPVENLLRYVVDRWNPR